MRTKKKEAKQRKNRKIMRSDICFTHVFHTVATKRNYFCHIQNRCSSLPEGWPHCRCRMLLLLLLLLPFRWIRGAVDVQFCCFIFERNKKNHANSCCNPNWNGKIQTFGWQRQHTHTRWIPWIICNIFNVARSGWIRSYKYAPVAQSKLT